jgi:hypothetical protein
VDIQGSSDVIPPAFVTFDDPHLPAGTLLSGAYPSNEFDWGPGVWKIAPPFGKFGTFHLALANSPDHAEFHFLAPRVFLGLDVYNDGPAEAKLKISSPETQTVVLILEPGEIRRLRTAWQIPSSKVSFEFTNSQALHFDNLAFQRD